MIPRTLSASSLQVAQLCMDRWKAEYMDRAANMSNNAADVGTACHAALETFVKQRFIDKTLVDVTRKQELDVLIGLYQIGFVQTFGHTDFTTDEYEDGLELVKKWHKRTDLAAKPMMHVESAELKETIKVPYYLPDGTKKFVNFNYIMDRVDQIEPTIWEVVDYKSIRVPLQPGDLENKIQARAYALAIQIKHPEATKIIVTFDQLRWEPISFVFTRADNVAFWRFLCEETQRIVNTREEDVRPKLNLECGFCVKKFSCKLMKSNVAAGGIHSLSIEESVDMVAQLQAQMKANKSIVDALEEQILRHAAESETLEWVTDDGAYEVAISSARKRTFPADRAAEIMGAELFAQMGSMTLGNLEKIIKDESLDADMRQQLKDLISFTQGNLGVKIKPKRTI